MNNIKKTDPAFEFKAQWQSMWHNRVDDKIRAEGIAKEDYKLLAVERGTVIIATRKFKLLDYYDLLKQHKALSPDQIIPPNPQEGGWRKFIKSTIHPQNTTKHGRQRPQEPDKNHNQQPKKGGRGWLHFKA